MNNEGLLPTAIRTELDADFPGWAPVETNAETVTNCKQPGSPFKHWLVWGDFDGDGETDYAIEIQRSGQTFVLMFLRRAVDFKQITVEEFPADKPHWDLLGIARKGDTISDLSNNSSRTLGADAVVGIGCEKSAMAYVYTGSGFDQVWMSD